MPAVFMKNKLPVGDDHVTNAARCAEIVHSKHPSVSSADIKAAAVELAALGIPWLTVLQLLFRYGPMLTSLVNDIISALGSHGGLTLEMLNTWIATYGPQVKQMVTDILAALGLNLPT